MKLELDKQELRLIEAGLELRNAHNIKAINGELRIPRHNAKSNVEELNKILKIQEKVQKIYEISKDIPDPIKLTTKQYESLKKQLGEIIDESDKDRIISNVLGQQVIIID